MVRIMRPIAIRFPAQGCRTGLPMDQLLCGIFGNDTARINNMGSHFVPFLSVFQPICCRDHQTCARRPWIKVLKLQGFSPRDITVKTEGNKVRVHAKHVQKSGEDVDVIEKIRVVEVSDDVDIAQLKVMINNVGELVLKAPIKKQESGIDTNKKTMGQSQVQENCDNQATQDLSAHNRGHNNAGTEDVDEAQGKQTSSITEAGDAQAGIQSDDHRQAHPNVSRCQSPVTSEDFEIVENQEPTCPPNSATETAETLPEELMSNSRKEEVTQEKQSNKKENDQQDKHLTGVTSGEPSLYEFKIPLDDIPMENVSIRCRDNVVYVDAEILGDTDEVTKRKEMHHSFPLPVGAFSENAVATVSSKGELVVRVPFAEKAGGHEQSIRIETA